MSLTTVKNYRNKNLILISEELRPYFPEIKVLNGLFELVEHLYNLFIKPIDLPSWHKDVKSFAIYNAKGRTYRLFLY